MGVGRNFPVFFSLSQNGFPWRFSVFFVHYGFLLVFFLPHCPSVTKVVMAQAFEFCGSGFEPGSVSFFINGLIHETRKLQERQQVWKTANKTKAKAKTTKIGIVGTKESCNAKGQVQGGGKGRGERG